MADVTFECEEYKKMRPLWNAVSDVCGGQHAIKKAGDKYLPRPNKADLSEENLIRFEQYLDRAVFYNATGRTRQGLVGAAFRKKPEVNISSTLDYILEDIDGGGVTLAQQSHSVLSDVLTRGRSGLLADYPTVARPQTRKDMADNSIRSTCVVINADNIINWRVSKVGGVYKLSLVVIREYISDVSADGFGVDKVEQYRALKLGPDGYFQEVYKKNSSTNRWVLTSTITPLTGQGKKWLEIPFVFCGAQNNDPVADMPPLYDLAMINIGHYRNSADYEDSVYFCGQAQPSISGLTVDWRDHLEKNGVYVGSRTPMLLPAGGKFEFAQVEPNTLSKEAMDSKEKQMIAVGARLIEQGAVAKTATEDNNDSNIEHSVLSLAVDNVSSAYTKIIGWMGVFMNAEGEPVYQISKDFIEASLDPQMLTALVGLWQSGKMPSSDFWAQLRKYGLIDEEKTDEDVQGEIDANPKGLDL